MIEQSNVYQFKKHTLTSPERQTQAWLAPDWPALCAYLRGELRKAPIPWASFIKIEQCGRSWQLAQDPLSLKKDTDNIHPSSTFTSLPNKLHLGGKGQVNIKNISQIKNKIVKCGRCLAELIPGHQPVEWGTGLRWAWWCCSWWAATWRSHWLRGALCRWLRVRSSPHSSSA